MISGMLTPSLGSMKIHYGIGLYITNEIVKGHNGQLILENDKEINGAKVTIEIPFL